jgi:ESF2/ABP1 family protein
VDEDEEDDEEQEEAKEEELVSSREEEEDLNHDGVSGSDLEESINDSHKSDNDTDNVDTDEEDEEEERERLKKEALAYRESLEKRGVIYMSRIPPFMKPNKVRTLLEEYGEITRLFLAEEGESSVSILVLLNHVFKCCCCRCTNPKEEERTWWQWIEAISRR